MLRFALRKLLTMAATMLAASFVIFGSLSLAPGDPETFLIRSRTVSEEFRAAVRAQFMLDEPFLLRYVHWLGAVLRGDLGTSLVFREQVTGLLASRITTTIWLVGYASILIVVLGGGLGLLAGLRGRGVLDNTIVVGTTAGLAVPSFVAATALVSIFSMTLGWFPASGGGEGPVGTIHHLTLPACALAVSSLAVMTQTTRAAIRGELARDHVATAVSRGLPWRRVVGRHVVRNALIPVTTVAGVTIPSLIAGAIIVEQAFGLNGVGGYLVQSINARDFPVVQAICLVLVGAFVLANTVVDLLYGVLDPRVRLGGAAL
ncbi:ABC transporter permease [Streptosporangium sp. NPDC051022]|uniref:ABC transporter permease n=1 Tax=Streptosporangium sp. NPDC051022 TaxID=3155752 RepID=UPI0034127CA4